jgi:hypothetical protein
MTHGQADEHGVACHVVICTLGFGFHTHPPFSHAFARRHASIRGVLSFPEALSWLGETPTHV